ncbi:MAG: M1 family metallopeptidase [Rhodanobacter sp.]
MKKLKRLFVLVVLLLHAGAALAVAESPPLGRLPRWAMPESYRLSFRVDPAQAGFSGSATIALRLAKASDHLWLHGKSLEVDKVVVIDAAGKAHAGRYVAAAPQAGVARIDFGSVLPAQRISLTIDYRASYDADLEGLFKVDHAGHAYARTEMEPLGARLAFPCFDEPGFRTPFTLRLTVPAGQTAVANTRPVKEVADGKGWKTVSFAPTLPLPTYLVAFGVGPWDIASAPDIAPNSWRPTPLPLRSIAYAGEAKRMQHVMAETPAIIHALENYYGFGYPWGKLDLLDVDGGMENPGLVVLGDLGSQGAEAPARAVQGSFNLAAHELAHQWTGDTVTLEWWDDIWLNEAVTTWMQEKVTMEVHPEYRADLDRVDGVQEAMANDSLVSARSIRQPIADNGDIMNAFDGITYQKGAGVVAMFENYVGEKAFQKGMRAYIRKHRFGNAVADDLVSSIATAAGKGESFKRAFDSFLDQSGVPYVQVKLDQRGGRTLLHLSQSRYLPLGSAGDSRRIWGIPVCVRYGTARSGKDGMPSSRVACTMLDKATGSMALAGAGDPTWVMPNANASGYYRFGLGRQELAGLIAAFGKLDDAEQLAYADAIGASFRHGDIDAGDVLAALKPLTVSKIRKVAIAPLEQVEWIYDHEAVTDAQRHALAAWAKDAYLPRLERLGYRRKPGEPADDALMRATLARSLALEFRVPGVRQALLEQGDAALGSGADGRPDLAVVDRDLLGAVLGVTVQQHGGNAVDALIAELPHTTDVALRYAILSGLGSATDPAVAGRVRDFALDKQVVGGEMFNLLRSSPDTRASRDAMWRWFTSHYAQVLDRMGGLAGNFLPLLAAGDGCSPAEVDRLQAFFGSRKVAVSGIGRNLAQVSEAIRLCSALKARQDPASILR